MCRFLKIHRSIVYYYLNRSISSKSNLKLVEQIKEIFRKSKNNYGTRKIKKKLRVLGYQVSRRKISKIMQENSLVSNYTVAQYKVHNLKCNEAKTENILDREFNKRDNLEVVVSDLTYVRVGKSWNYICLLINLYNGEIFGYSVSKNKDAKLIEQALLSSKYSLSKIQLFHSDRGSEYDNKVIDDFLKTFKIKRSLSRKGNPFEGLPQHSKGTMP